MHKTGITLFLGTVLLNTAIAANNTAVVEVNSNAVSNAACYTRSDNNQPFFDSSVIFAANIHTETNDPNQPIIYSNPQVQATLDSDQIEKLHQQNIKVLIGILGDHQNAGWSCMTDAGAKQEFAKQIVTFVNNYNLDGVMIDDEYSSCTATNTRSLPDIAGYIKSDPEFSGKLLTMALYNDQDDFLATTLGKSLDYGFEMSYDNSNFSQRLSSYELRSPALKDKLELGAATNVVAPTPQSIGDYTTKSDLPGTTVYDIQSNSQDYLTNIAQGELGNNVSINVTPNCLD